MKLTINCSRKKNRFFIVGEKHSANVIASNCVRAVQLFCLEYGTDFVCNIYRVKRSVAGCCTLG